MKRKKVVLLLPLALGVLLIATCSLNVTQAPSEHDFQAALDQLAAQGVELGSPLADGNARAANFLQASAEFHGDAGNVFDLTASCNGSSCAPGGSSYTFSYYLYDIARHEWMYWGRIANRRCFSQFVTYGQYTVGGDTSVRFVALVYFNTTLLGYGYSNWVFLDRPY